MGDVNKAPMDGGDSSGWHLLARRVAMKKRQQRREGERGTPNTHFNYSASVGAAYYSAPAERQRPKVCKRCNQLGHIAVECSQKDISGWGCGEEGHRKEACPNVGQVEREEQRQAERRERKERRKEEKRSHRSSTSTSSSYKTSRSSESRRTEDSKRPSESESRRMDERRESRSSSSKGELSKSSGGAKRPREVGVTTAVTPEAKRRAPDAPPPKQRYSYAQASKGAKTLVVFHPDRKPVTSAEREKLGLAFDSTTVSLLSQEGTGWYPEIVACWSAKMLGRQVGVEDG